MHVQHDIRHVTSSRRDGGVGRGENISMKCDGDRLCTDMHTYVHTYTHTHHTHANPIHPPIYSIHPRINLSEGLGWALERVKQAISVGVVLEGVALGF